MVTCSKCQTEMRWLYNNDEGKGVYKCPRCGRDDVVYLGERRVNDSLKGAGYG